MQYNFIQTVWQNNFTHGMFQLSPYVSRDDEIAYFNVRWKIKNPVQSYTARKTMN